jgi:hypothetical protein
MSFTSPSDFRIGSGRRAAPDSGGSSVAKLPMALIYGQNPYGGDAESIQSGPMGSVGLVIALPIASTLRFGLEVPTPCGRIPIKSEKQRWWLVPCGPARTECLSLFSWRRPPGVGHVGNLHPGNRGRAGLRTARLVLNILSRTTFGAADRYPRTTSGNINPIRGATVLLRPARYLATPPERYLKGWIWPGPCRHAD